MYKNTNNWRTVRLGAVILDTKDCKDTQIKSTILSCVMNCVCHRLQTHLTFVSSGFCPWIPFRQKVSSQSTDRGQRHNLLWHFFTTAKSHYSVVISDSDRLFARISVLRGLHATSLTKKKEENSWSRKKEARKLTSQVVNLFLFFLSVRIVCTSDGS